MSHGRGTSGKTKNDRKLTTVYNYLHSQSSLQTVPPLPEGQSTTLVHRSPSGHCPLVAPSLFSRPYFQFSRHNTTTPNKIRWRFFLRNASALLNILNIFRKTTEDNRTLLLLPLPLPLLSRTYRLPLAAGRLGVDFQWRRKIRTATNG